jgi:hypothetical protein
LRLVSGLYRDRIEIRLWKFEAVNWPDIIKTQYLYNVIQLCPRYCLIQLYFTCRNSVNISRSQFGTML